MRMEPDGSGSNSESSGAVCTNERGAIALRLQVSKSCYVQSWEGHLDERGLNSVRELRAGG